VAGLYTFTVSFNALALHVCNHVLRRIFLVDHLLTQIAIIPSTIASFLRTSVPGSLGFGLRCGVQRGVPSGWKKS
jgi:hypothetical protein